MKRWIVESENRLLTEVKKNFDSAWTTKDLRWAIEHHRCWINGNVERFCSRRVKPGDELVLYPKKRPQLTFDPSCILYEDSAIVAYNKPAGIDSPTLATRGNLHLIHRLDRDTTGVFLLAKTREAQKTFEEAFRKREVEKTYYACVQGAPSKKGGVIEGKMAPISRREGAVKWGVRSNGVWARTDWKVEKKRGERSLICCHPFTGRTHQIRVHLHALGIPVLGDVEYGGPRQPLGIFRPLLHAASLKIGALFVEAPMAGDVLQALDGEPERARHSPSL